MFIDNLTKAINENTKQVKKMIACIESSPFFVLVPLHCGIEEQASKKYNRAVNNLKSLDKRKRKWAKTWLKKRRLRLYRHNYYLQMTRNL